jgi:hypothetical protein
MDFDFEHESGTSKPEPVAKTSVGRGKRMMEVNFCEKM